MTAAGNAPRGARSIGAALDALRPDFPDVTISKIRFLESEGLITPDRTPAGYRQFSTADVERLRFVLAAQRDHYLPLKVIKDQLDTMDTGLGARTAVPRLVRMTREALLSESGISADLLTELLAHGLIRAGSAGFFDAEAVLVARTAHAMAEFGVEPRHLRAFRSAAEREAGLLAQIAGPVARQRDPGAQARAEELVRELAALSVTLHAVLVKNALRESMGR